jgi:CRP-like cAMP-binding protein
MQNLICSSDAYALLRDGQFQPYAQLDAALQNQFCDGVRFVPLRQGERLTTLGGTQVSVLSGKARLSSSGRTLTDSLTRAKPFMVSARGDILQAVDDTVLALADRDFLDLVSAWHALARHAQETGDVAAARLTQLPRATPFRRIPLECVEAAFACMRARQVVAGSEIARQGTPSDTFFTLKSGRAEAWQQGFNGNAPHKVADLGPGDTFGEEALIGGSAHKVSVRMASDGELLELPRTEFLALVAKPLIQEVTAATAKGLIESDWRALDVRYAEEFGEGHIAGAQWLPLQALRRQAETALSRTERYVVLCNSGKRSAVAALILSQRGYQVVSLKNGLRESALDLLKVQSTQATQAVA